jgi:hypothetical protein
MDADDSKVVSTTRASTSRKGQIMAAGKRYLETCAFAFAEFINLIMHGLGSQNQQPRLRGFSCAKRLLPRLDTISPSLIFLVFQQ